MPQLRTLLGCFLFSGDSVEKPVSVLSGGRAQPPGAVQAPALARQLPAAGRAHQPSGHPIEGHPDGFAAGVWRHLVFVSHDRYFLDGLATKVLEVGNRHGHPYLGNYEDYLAKKKSESETAGGVPAPAEESRAESSAPGRDRSAARERSRRKVNPIRIQHLSEKIDDLEAAIHTHETRIAALGQRLATEELYRDYTLFRATMDEHARLQEELAAFMAEWEKLQAELALMKDANE